MKLANAVRQLREDFPSVKEQIKLPKLFEPSKNIKIETAELNNHITFDDPYLNVDFTVKGSPVFDNQLLVRELYKDARRIARDVHVWMDLSVEDLEKLSRSLKYGYALHAHKSAYISAAPPGKTHVSNPSINFELDYHDGRAELKLSFPPIFDETGNQIVERLNLNKADLALTPGDAKILCPKVGLKFEPGYDVYHVSTRIDKLRGINKILRKRITNYPGSLFSEVSHIDAYFRTVSPESEKTIRALEEGFSILRDAHVPKDVLDYQVPIDTKALRRHMSMQFKYAQKNPERYLSGIMMLLGIPEAVIQKDRKKVLGELRKPVTKKRVELAVARYVEHVRKHTKNFDCEKGLTITFQAENIPYSRLPDVPIDHVSTKTYAPGRMARVINQFRWSHDRYDKEEDVSYWISLRNPRLLPIQQKLTDYLGVSIRRVSAAPTYIS